MVRTSICILVSSAHHKNLFESRDIHWILSVPGSKTTRTAMYKGLMLLIIRFRKEDPHIPVLNKAILGMTTSGPLYCANDIIQCLHFH